MSERASQLDVRLIVGLGNPGREYERTRHNVGFMVVEELLRAVQRRDVKDLLAPFAALNIEFEASGYNWKSWAEGTAESFELAWVLRGVRERFWLFKSLKYMNLSGQPLAEFMRFYKLAAPQMIVVYDDMDLPFGELRLRQGGGDGGHNGVKSIASCLGDRGFGRIRVGIGRPNSLLREAGSPSTGVELGGGAGDRQDATKVGSALEVEHRVDVSKWLLSNFSEREVSQLGNVLKVSCQSVLEVVVAGLRSAQNKFSGSGVVSGPENPQARKAGT